MSLTSYNEISKICSSDRGYQIAYFIRLHYEESMYYRSIKYPFYDGDTA
jgi:hypothetical protein